MHYKISNLLLIILFCSGLKTAGQDRNVSNDSIFILIDPQFKELYSFNKEWLESIKIMKYDKRGLPYEIPKKIYEDHEIVIVTDIPPPSNYVKFVATPWQKETSSIKGLKTYSILDLSKAISSSNKDVSKADESVWRSPTGDFYFIEKLDSGNYLVWQMYIQMRE